MTFNPSFRTDKTFLGTTPNGDVVSWMPFLYGWLYFKFGKDDLERSLSRSSFTSYQKDRYRITRLEGHLFSKRATLIFARRIAPDIDYP